MRAPKEEAQGHLKAGLFECILEIDNIANVTGMHKYTWGGVRPFERPTGRPGPGRDSSQPGPLGGIWRTNLQRLPQRALSSSAVWHAPGPQRHQTKRETRNDGGASGMGG
jgi:hypothetical protein